MFKLEADNLLQDAAGRLYLLLRSMENSKTPEEAFDSTMDCLLNSFPNLLKLDEHNETAILLQAFYYAMEILVDKFQDKKVSWDALKLGTYLLSKGEVGGRIDESFSIVYDAENIILDRRKTNGPEDDSHKHIRYR